MIKEERTVRNDDDEISQLKTNEKPRVLFLRDVCRRRI